jgi:hypothetical protein
LSCPSSLREEARRRETPAIAEHPEALTPTLSLALSSRRGLGRGLLQRHL